MITTRESMLSRDEKRKLFKKLGKYLSAKIQFIKDTEMQYKELSAKSGIAQNRLSELANRGWLQEKTLIGLIGGKFVTIDELVSKTQPLTEKEKGYLQSLYFHERQEIKDFLTEWEQEGATPKQILDAIKKAKDRK